MSEKLKTPAPEGEKNLEKLLNLRESYDNQIKLLNQTGILTILPETMSLGIVGIDGKEHPVPTYEEIEERLKSRKEELEVKMKQGFTKLLLVPMAMPLDTLVEKLKQRLVAHKKDGKLFTTDEKPVELDIENPMWVWDEYTGADKDGKLVYYPKTFDKNSHKGKTKKELIDEGSPWRISLVEDLPDLPAENSGKSIGGRKQLEANKTAIDYLKMLQTEKLYQQEDGFTPEEWLTYFLNQIEAKNQIIDNYQSKGKVSFLTGAFFPSQGLLPCGFFNLAGRRAGLDGDHPTSAYSDYATRSSVGVW